MRLSSLASILVLAIGLSGCGGPAADEPSPQHARGRYVGIGTYPAGRLWQHIALPKEAGRATAASTSDDGQIVVVVDSQSGEIRQCGNLSGFCIGMNPWTGALPAAQAEPVTLTKHEADLQREDEEELRRQDEEARRDRGKGR